MNVLDRQVYLYPRNSIFQAQFVDPNSGKLLTARSTGKQKRDEALDVVYEWVSKGIPQKQQKTKTKKKPPRPLAVELSTSSLLSELKKVDISMSNVVKIEKILKDKGLVDLIVRKEAPEAELLNDYLQRFWDYNRSPPMWKKNCLIKYKLEEHILTRALGVSIYIGCPILRISF